jgi:hypothetical protein
MWRYIQRNRLLVQKAKLMGIDTTKISSKFIIQNNECDLVDKIKQVGLIPG